MYSDNPEFEVDMNVVLPEDLQPLNAQLQQNNNDNNDVEDMDDEDEVGDEESYWEEAEDHDFLDDEVWDINM
jgi:hypothetical protein